jgi:transcriptional antiterminator NusG
MSLQEPKEQFEREEAEPTEESLDSSIESPLSDSDSLATASESESIDVPIEESSPASSDDSDFAHELESAEDVPPDGKQASSSEEPPRPEVTEGPAWFVIHCYSGYENKVRHNLEQRIETMGMKDKIFDVVIPTQEEIEVKDGKRRTVERHIFPGYVLVNMQLTEESWYVVRNTPGVTGFVGMGNQPTPLRPEEVSQIIKRMEAEAPTVKVTFKVGERVRIIDGPFNDFRGVVSEIDMERTKVRVLVSFFGRETPVELDFLQVEKS